ncbi:MAG TPA: STAS domain-containing protein [Candidatus Sumerlaeota bacterium]|nr:STAS domain-containing protein [Candidatus Sumerlaeota bacterium]
MSIVINRVKIGKVLVISISGKVHADEAEQLRDFFNSPIVGEHRYVLLDLLDLDYICSAGLRAVLQIAKALLERKGELRIVKPNRPVFEIFQTAGLDTCLSFYLTGSDAIWEWIRPEDTAPAGACGKIPQA